MISSYNDEMPTIVVLAFGSLIDAHVASLHDVVVSMRCEKRGQDPLASKPRLLMDFRPKWLGHVESPELKNRALW